MVTVDRIHFKVGELNPYLKTNIPLNHEGNLLEWNLEEHLLYIDRIKISEIGQPVMVPTEDGDVPLIETVPFDREVKGLLRMDFVLDVSNGAVSSAILLLPEGVEKVLGYNISASTQAPEKPEVKNG